MQEEKIDQFQDRNCNDHLEQEEDELIGEFDVFLDLSSQKNYVMNFMTTPASLNEDNYKSVSTVRRRPIQHKIEMDIKGTNTKELIRVNLKLRSPRRESGTPQMTSNASTL